MILVIDNGNGSFSINYHPEKLNKTEEELLEIGALLESVQTPQVVEGKSPTLKFDGTNLYYEYVDIPKTEIELLQEEMELQKQTILELSIMVSGGAI